MKKVFKFAAFLLAAGLVVGLAGCPAEAEGEKEEKGRPITSNGRMMQTQP